MAVLKDRTRLTGLLAFFRKKGVLLLEAPFYIFAGEEGTLWKFGISLWYSLCHSTDITPASGYSGSNTLWSSCGTTCKQNDEPKFYHIRCRLQL